METLDFLLVTVAVEVVLVSAAMAFAIRATCSFFWTSLILILSVLVLMAATITVEDRCLAHVSFEPSWQC